MKSASIAFDRALTDLQTLLVHDENKDRLLARQDTEHTPKDLQELLTGLRSSAAPFLIRQARHSTQLVLLYGAFERFIEQMIVGYGDALSALVPEFEQLPENVQSSHREKSVDALHDGVWLSRQPDLQTAVRLIENLHSCESRQHRYHLNSVVYARHGANFRISLLNRMFNSLGVNNLSSKLVNSKPFQSYLAADQAEDTQSDNLLGAEDDPSAAETANTEDDPSAAETANTEDDPSAAETANTEDDPSAAETANTEDDPSADGPLGMIDDLAERRNEIAHGSPSDLLSSERLHSFIDFFRVLGKSLHTVLCQHLGEFIAAHHSVSLGKVDAVHYKSIFRLNTEALPAGTEVKLGQLVAIELPGDGPHDLGKVVNIRVESEDIDSIRTEPGVDVAIQLDHPVRENANLCLVRTQSAATGSLIEALALDPA